MIRIAQTGTSFISARGFFAIAVLLSLFCLAAVFYASGVSGKNERLERSLRDEKLRSERLLSEKLALEKDFQNTKDALKELEHRMTELADAITVANQRLAATESELAVSKKKNWSQLRPNKSKAVTG